VKAVGGNTTRLLMGGRWDSQITIPGVGPKGNNYPWSFFNAITPGYFDALRIPIKAGRDVSWDDWGSGQERCLVNEALVREYLKGENPVGRMMAQGRDATPNIEIIGVFADARYEAVRGVIPRQTFVSLGSGNRIRNFTGMTVYARTDRDPVQMMGTLREAVRRVDANLVINAMRTLDDQLAFRLSNERMLSFLATGFALLATLLAVVGLYGVLAFVVTRRTREIGIRIALGAEQTNVVKLVLSSQASRSACRAGGSSRASCSASTPTTRWSSRSPPPRCSPPRCSPASCRRCAPRASTRSARCAGNRSVTIARCLSARRAGCCSRPSAWRRCPPAPPSASAACACSCWRSTTSTATSNRPRGPTARSTARPPAAPSTWPRTSRTRSGTTRTRCWSRPAT
jgi:hypothetical protein